MHIINLYCTDACREECNWTGKMLSMTFINFNTVMRRRKENSSDYGISIIHRTSSLPFSLGELNAARQHSYMCEVPQISNITDLCYVHSLAMHSDITLVSPMTNLWPGCMCGPKIIQIEILSLDICISMNGCHTKLFMLYMRRL